MASAASFCGRTPGASAAELLPPPIVTPPPMLPFPPSVPPVTCTGPLPVVFAAMRVPPLTVVVPV